MSFKQGKLELEIMVRISQQGYPGGLEIRESYALRAGSFLEMAKVLGMFHDLCEQVAKENQ